MAEEVVEALGAACPRCSGGFLVVRDVVSAVSCSTVEVACVQCSHRVTHLWRWTEREPMP